MDSKTTNKVPLGVRIRQLRTLKGYTQKYVAEKGNFSGYTLGRWETGLNKPQLVDFVNLAKALDVSLDDFLDGVDLDAKMNEGESGFTKTKAGVE